MTESCNDSPRDHSEKRYFGAFLSVDALNGTLLVTPWVVPHVYTRMSRLAGGSPLVHNPLVCIIGPS